MTCSGTWVLLWHALWHAHSPSSPYPSMSLALSPLGFSCVSMCVVPGVFWCILTHSCAFMCIHVHSCAFMCILKHHEASKIASRRSSKSGIFPPKCTGIHNDAIRCITVRMQHIQNAPRSKLRMYWNALRCGMYRMQHTKNAHECILCNECTRMQQAKRNATRENCVTYQATYTCNQNRMHSNAHECTLYQMQH
jgi:hypothetical protein